MKRDPHFHDSVFRVPWVATFQKVCDDALVLLGDATLDVGDSRLNVLQFSSRDHCPAPDHTRTHHMLSRDEDVRYNTRRHERLLRRRLFNSSGTYQEQGARASFQDDVTLSVLTGV